MSIKLDDIIPNRFQPREVFDEQALKELAVSIKEHGVIQPIIVRQVDNKYEIIAGERRYKASTMAGLTKIPAIVKNLDDKESSKVALIENLQRRDLTPIEEARTYQKILELEDEMTQEQLAATMGKTQSSVSNKLRLLALPEEVQDALLNEKISERHARSLLQIQDKDKQDEWLDRIINERLTVRSLDKEIKEYMKEENNMDNNEIKDEVIETPQEEIKEEAVETNVTEKPIEEVKEEVTESENTPKDDELYEKKPIPNKFFNFLEDEEVNMNVQEHPPVVESAPVEEEIELLDFDISSPEVNMIEPKKDMSKARNLVDNLVSELRSNEYDVTLDTEEADKLKFIIEISKD